MQAFHEIILALMIIAILLIQVIIINSLRLIVRFSPTAHAAMKNRKRYRLFLFILPLLITLIASVLFLLVEVFLNASEFELDEDERIVMFISLLTITLFYSARSVRKHIKSISVFSKDTFLRKHKEFILYLRPFDSDKYNDQIETMSVLPRDNETKAIKRDDASTSAKYSFIDFSEDKLVMELTDSQSYPVCAIGITEEAEQPVGAIRIYAQDHTWQADVSELMTMAKAIIVLVSDKENCIWEIRRTAALLDKTIFIIEDTSYYESVRNIVGEIIDLPILTSSNTDNTGQQSHFVIKKQNGKFSFKEYDHTIDGYKTISYFLFSVILPFDIKGIFSMMDEAYSQFQEDEWSSQKRMHKMSSYVCSNCPMKVNEQLTLTSCQLKGGDKLYLKFSLSGQQVSLKDIKHYLYPLQFNLIERFMAETETIFKAATLRSGFAFHMTFKSLSQNGLLKVSISKSAIEKRIDENQESIRMSSDWFSQILVSE